MRRIRLSIVTTVLLVSVAPAWAQTSFISGRVTDSQGGAVTDAVVTLIPAGGAVQATRSINDGRFDIADVPIGEYVVQVDAPGFSRSQQRLTVGAKPTSLDITLQIAGLSASVDVVGSGASPLLGPTVTATRLGLAPLEIPASIQVMTGELVRDRGDVSLQDATTRAVGVTAQGTPGNGGSAMIARGFAGMGSVMQLYDGGQLFIGGGTVTFPFDSWSVERIEVLAGPSSVLYGTGAIGGVVNVVPRKPNPNAGENNATLTVGSQKVFRGAFDSTGPISPRWSYRLNISQNNSGGWVDRGDSSRTALSASVRAQAATNLTFTLSEDFGYQQPEGYFGTPTINGQLDPSLRSTNYNVSDAAISYRDSWTQSAAEWRPSPNLLVRNNLHALNTNRQWRNVELYTFQPSTRSMLRTSYVEIFHHEQQYGDHAEVLFNRAVWGKPNTVSAGFDYNWIRFEHVNDSPYGGSSIVPLIDPTPGTFINMAGTLPKYQTHTNQESAFAEDRLAILSRLSIVGGVRLDRYSVNRLDLIANTTSTRTFTPPSWRGGVVYMSRPDVSVYAQYATANDAIGNFISQSSQQQALNLTTGRQIEIGAKQSVWRGRAEWTVAGYQIVKNNLAVPTPGNPSVSQQVGQQSSRGIEATAALSIGRHVRIDGNAAILKAQFDDFGENVSGVVVSRNGNTPPNVPQRTGNVWATWTITSDWYVRGGLRYVGDRFWNNANTSTAPGYTVVDAGVRRRLTDKMSVDVRVFNAFDTLYAVTFSGNSAAPQWLLGRPRAGDVMLSVKF